MLLDLNELGALKSGLRKNNHISENELNKSLISACQQGYTTIVQLLVQLGANVNCRDTNENTPLLISVENSLTDVVEVLLTNKADVNACNSVGDSALILSIHSSRSTDITMNLLKQPDVNIDHQNHDGYTAIMKAAEIKNVDTLKILLDKYFSIGCITSAPPYIHIDKHKIREHNSNNVADYVSQWTTLGNAVNCSGENVHQIAERCGIGSVFQLLKEYVITKISPLELAVRANDIKSFYTFLDCDFTYAPERKISLEEVFLQIFRTCNNKNTNHFSENHIAMIKALLEHGADVNTVWLNFKYDRKEADDYRYERLCSTPVSRRWPLYRGRQINPILIAAKSGCVEILELLLTFGANVNRYDFRNSFHIALSHGHAECAKLLVQHVANMDFKQALKLAVDLQDTKYVKFLIENYKNKFTKGSKRTFEIQDILLRSIRIGNLKIIGQILDFGANINGVVGSGVCPLAESKNGEVAKFLVNRGANVNHIINIGGIRKCGPLIEVLYGRDIYDSSVVEVFQVLLENGASVNDRRSCGKTALMLAATKEGSRSVLQLLLDHGAELGETDREGNTALIHAARDGCSQNVSFLLQFIKDRKWILNLQNNEGLTALMCAVRSRNQFIIKDLIGQGADVNTEDTNGNTALLHLLLTSKEHEDQILRSLIQAGCDVNCQNDDGISPLMLAAKHCLKVTITVLLNSGADINAVSKKDNTKTALTYLLYKSYPDYDYVSCLEYLLDRGAIPSHLEATTILTEDTISLPSIGLLDVHKQNTSFDLIEKGTQDSALELLKFHISKDELNKSLISACQRGYTSIVQLLVQLGANVNCRVTNENTPLLFSVENGLTDVVEVLLTNKADVNVCNSFGDSALIVSIHSSRSTEITENLLKQPEVNIDHQNQDGYTAIMKAAEIKNIDMLKILLEKYFNIDCIQISALCYVAIDECKTHEHTSNSVSDYVSQWIRLRETVSLKGENVYQIAERCGIGSAFKLLQQHVSTKISALELALKADDIKLFHIFLDCNFVYAPEREISLGEVFFQIFQTCSDKDVIYFTENEIAMIKALLEYGAYVHITSFDCTPVFDREQADSYKCESLCSTTVSLLRPLVSKRQIDPLLIAVKSGCVQVLQLLLTFDADVHRPGFENSPVHIALCHGHTDCAKLLIQHGANLDFYNALEFAVDQQKPKYVRFLIENYQNEFMKDVERSSDIHKILLRSVRMGNLEIIDHVLDLRANINDAMGSSMCHLTESKNGGVAKFLIGRGANANEIVNMGEVSSTPLIKVLHGSDLCDNSVVEVIQVLLENGASVNDRSWCGRTALMLAAGKEGSRSVLQFLLDHGAELSERDSEGDTALIHAAREGCSQNVSFLLQSIKDRKWILNLQNNEGLTALMCVIRSRNPFIIKDLIGQGADVNTEDTNGNTALLHLLLTSKEHEDQILRSLVQAGCDVNCQNDEGISPLMLAAKKYSRYLMYILLDSGAEINAVSKKVKTKTALTHLLFRPHRQLQYFSCLDYLLDRGASSSYLDAVTFHRMIIYYKTREVLNLIRCGLGPASIEPHSIPSLLLESHIMSSCSPLFTALSVGNNVLAHHFVGNLFLTHSDVSLLGHNKMMRQHLERENFKECRNIFNELSTQPMTLFNLSFVAVSTAIGATSGREIRVNDLPLPQIIKENLLFRSQNAFLTVPETYDSDLENWNRISRDVRAREELLEEVQGAGHSLE